MINQNPEDYVPPSWIALIKQVIDSPSTIKKSILLHFMPDVVARISTHMPMILFKTLEQNSPVHTIAYHPDGQQLASGAEDGTIRLWNPYTGEEMQTLSGHTNQINAIAYRSDGKQLAAGTEDGTVQLWDLNTRAIDQTLSGYIKGRITSVAYRPNGHQLALGANDGTITLWHPDTNHIQTLHDDWAVTAVAYRPDGEELASGSAELKFWNPNTGEETHGLDTKQGSINSLAYRSDGQQLTAGGMDGTIVISGPNTMHTLAGGTGAITSVAYRPDGYQLASGAVDGTISIWDPATGKVMQKSAPISPVSDITYHPDGRQLASSSWNNSSIYLWNYTPDDAKLLDQIRNIKDGFTSNQALLLALLEDYYQHGEFVDLSKMEGKLKALYGPEPPMALHFKDIFRSLSPRLQELVKETYRPIGPS